MLRQARSAVPSTGSCRLCAVSKGLTVACVRSRTGACCKPVSRQAATDTQPFTSPAVCPCQRVEAGPDNKLSMWSLACGSCRWVLMALHPAMNS